MTKHVCEILAFKFQAVAEKTAKNIRGLLYFAAPCIPHCKVMRVKAMTK